MRTIQTPPDSDDEDSGPNFRSVRDNARRTMELAHQLLPGLKRENLRVDTRVPLGMNTPDAMKASLQELVNTVSHAFPTETSSETSAK